MKKLIYLLVVLVIASCLQKDKIPKDVLPPQQMHPVMWDLLRADEYISGFMQVDSATDIRKKRFEMYEQVFKMHATSREVFSKSLSFYESRPDLMKIIADSLRGEERKINETIPPETKPVTDTSVVLRKFKQRKEK
jgi:hypothetical protein